MAIDYRESKHRCSERKIIQVVRTSQPSRYEEENANGRRMNIPCKSCIMAGKEKSCFIRDKARPNRRQRTRSELRSLPNSSSTDLLESEPFQPFSEFSHHKPVLTRPPHKRQ